MTVLVEDSLRLLAGRGVLWITDNPSAHAGLPSPMELKDDARVRRMNVHLLAVLDAEAAQAEAAWRGVNGAVLDFNDGGFAARSSIAAVLRIVALAASHKARIVILDHPPALGGEQHDGPMWRPVAGSDVAIPIRYGISIGEALKLYAGTLPAGADLHVVPARGVRRSQFLGNDSKLPWTSPVSEVKSVEDAIVASALLYLEGTSLSLGRGTDEPLVQVGAPWLDTKHVLDELADRPLTGVKFEATRFTPRHPSDGKFDGQSVPGIRIFVTDRQRVQTGRLALDLAWAVWHVHGDSLHLPGAAGAPGLGGALALVARGADPDSIVDSAMPALIAFQKKARSIQMYR
ncbi:MAG: exo-beta-N-acetylmuramidase NamZ domain-containing protein [Gemmatimonadaceae bacterium]